MSNDLIYGKNTTEGIVGCELVGDQMFLIGNKGDILDKLDHNYFVLRHKYSYGADRLDGDLYYKYVTLYDDYGDFQKGAWGDTKAIWNQKEASMLRHGFTYYKGMKVSDVSVLSFDIETTGLTHNDDSKVLLISNTFRDAAGKITRQLFCFDDFKDQSAMIEAWATWVRFKDPSILVGHNIFSFDLPYLRFCGGDINLGRNGSELKFGKKARQFRKDGSQSYDYLNVTCWGREIIDTFFLSIKYDIGRNYPSYGLKEIIKYENLGIEGRQFYNAGEIRHAIHNPTERKKIEAYAIHDADDALALYDLMVPSFFYYTQSIPMNLQEIINRATGSQVNAFMMRAYLQQGHSIPAPSEVEHFKGGISFGNAGVYDNVYKVDVASLYPSIMRQWKVYDDDKDPEGYFLQMVEYFTRQRLENKRLAKETGERHYKDLEQAQKIMINSAYGFLGARGLCFNSPENAEFVTAQGRYILERGLGWAERNGYAIVNADTDSFSYTAPDDHDFAAAIEDLNVEFPELISWEDDGHYEKVVIVKAKNYALKEAGQVKIKGSALKATMKEPALRRFITDVIHYILIDQIDLLPNLYHKYVEQIDDIGTATIGEWCSKKTITKSVLNPKATTQERILDAIGDKNVQEGDKIMVFFDTNTSLCLLENYKGCYSKDKLYEKLFKSIKIFETILDMTDFPNYKLKKNKSLLETKVS